MRKGLNSVAKFRANRVNFLGLPLRRLLLREMTAWLSGGLSQFSSITDQISTFTKDVLSETTEEIEGQLYRRSAINFQLARSAVLSGHNT